MLGRPVAKSTILGGIVCRPCRRGGVRRWHHPARRHSDRSFRSLDRSPSVIECRGMVSVLRTNFVSKYLPLIFIHEEMYYDGSKKKTAESGQSKGPRGRYAKCAESHTSISKDQSMARHNSLLSDLIFFSNRAHDFIPHLHKHYSPYEGLNRAISFKNRRN
jgi:hypothetical protein